MFLPSIQLVSDKRPNRLLQHPLLAERVGRCVVPELDRRRQAHDVLGEAVVQKRLPALDAMRHLDAVAQHGEQPVREGALTPDIQRRVQRVPLVEDQRARAPVERVRCRGAARVAGAEFGVRPGREERARERCVLREADKGDVVDLGARGGGRGGFFGARLRGTFYGCEDGAALGVG